jgi:site-specific recombinase XerC
MAEEGRVATRSLATLAVRYVTYRRGAGELNERSAAQIRSRLLDFAAHAPADPHRVGRRHVEAWLERPGLAPSYRRTRLSALRGFCRWCVVHGYMRRDPTAAARAPRVPEGVPKRLRPDEAQALVAVAAADPRTYLIVLLMLQECLRRAEVAALDVDDVDFAERTLAVRGKGGGGRHTAVLPISSETWGALTTYLAVEGHRYGPFVRNRVRAHGRLAASTVSELVHDAMVDAGVKRPGDASRTPHSLRHTGAHDMLAHTHDVRAVQQALRHSSVRSTEVYLRGQVGQLGKVMGGRRYDRSALRSVDEAG